MKTKILDLIDFEKVDILLEGFNKSTGFVTAILDLEGNVLSKSGWRQICTEFHRINPKTSKNCTVSDTVLANKMEEGEKYHFYQCLNGLVDVAVPIVIKGEHIANLFSGQFFFEEPNPSFFKKQAVKYGFNQEIYLKALKKVPVVSKDKVLVAMDFLLNMTEMISEMTFQKLEQMELNEAIKKNEHILSLFVEHSPASIAMFDNQMRYLVASHRFFADYNLGDQNLIGRSHYEVFPEISERWKEFHRRGLAGETLKENNDPFPRADGKTDWVRWEIRPWYETENQIGGIILFSEVITEQIVAREALIESQEIFRKAFEEAPMGIAMANMTDKRFIGINHSLCEMLGYSEEELIRLTFEDITHPDDRANDLVAVTDLFAGRIKKHTTEKRYLKKDGTLIWGTRSLTKISSTGNKPDYALAMIKDITERKLAELALIETSSNLKSLIDNREDSIWSLDRNFRYLIFNSTYAKIFNSQYHVELKKGMNSIDFLKPAETDFWKPKFESVFEGESITFEFSHQFETGIRYFQTSLFPIFENTAITGASAISMEITDRKMAEQNLVESEKKYRSLFENMNAGFVLFEVVQNEQGIPVDLIISAANDGFEKTTGLNLRDSIGKHLTQVLPGIENDEADWIGTYSKVALTGEFVQIEQGSELLGVYYSVSAFQASPKHCAVTFVDITARKKAEEELNEKRMFNESIINASPDIIYIYDIEERKNVFSNDGIKSNLGYTDQEIKQMGDQVLPLLMEPDDFNYYLQNTYPKYFTLNDKELVVHEFRMRNKSRNWHWFYCKESIYLRKPDGTPKQVFGVAVDITKRKQVEEQLRLSEEKFSNAFYTSPAAMSIARLSDGLFLDANNAFLNMFEYSFEEVIGHTTLEINMIGPEERSKIMQKIKETGGLTNAELTLKSKSGRNVHLLLSSKPITILDDVCNLTTMIDITDWKIAEKLLLESERRFRETLENVHLISAQINFNGEVIYCNPYLCELTGYTREEIVGKDWFSKFVPDIRPDVKEMFLKALESGKIEALYENPIRMKDGTERIIRFSNTVLLDPEGKVIGTTSIGEDITERKLAEAEIKTLNQTLEHRVEERTAQLKAVNKELETFTYSVSHDLKAPLRGIDGYSKLLIDIHGKDLNEEAKTFLSTIRSSTMQMNQLIEDLLEYSRLERSLMSSEKIKIKDLISSIISAHKNELNTGNYSLKIEIQDIELVADTKGLTIALRNILENAIKFTKGKTDPAIEIGLEEKTVSWILRISDNGIGFDMKYHQRIFEIFQRLQRAEDFQGTGVGLAMVTKAMQRMNGKAWAESVPGMGSTFYLEIPK